MGRVDCWKDAADLDIYGVTVEEANDLLYKAIEQVIASDPSEYRSCKLAYSPPQRWKHMVEINDCGFPWYEKENFIKFQASDWNRGEILLEKVYKFLLPEFGDRVKFKRFEWYDY